MWTAPKNDKTVMRALELANNGHHQQAAQLFQKASNQYRNHSEKEVLWSAARRHEKIAQSE